MHAGIRAGICCSAAVAAAAALSISLLGSLPVAASPTMVAAGAPTSACGSVEVGVSSAKDVAAAESCFSKAYTTCDTAGFSVTYRGADAGIERDFMTMQSANNGSCGVAEVVSHYKGSAVASSDTFVCSSITQNNDNLTFKACGADGDVVVPTNLTAATAGRLITLAYYPST